MNYTQQMNTNQAYMAFTIPAGDQEMNELIYGVQAMAALAESLGFQFSLVMPQEAPQPQAPARPARRMAARRRPQPAAEKPARLKIAIDEAQRRAAFEDIANSEFFARVKENAARLRTELHG